MSGLQRRRLLKLVGLGGAIGLATGTATAGRAIAGEQELRLRSPAIRPVGNPTTSLGGVVCLVGDLTGDGGGQKLGTFAGTRTIVGDQRVTDPRAPLMIEQHTLTLEGGTLFGTGMTSASADVDDEFVIVGGTGRFRGAAGTYRFTHRDRAFGGQGAAAFFISLEARSD